jgi:hypothetical protein
VPDCGEQLAVIGSFPPLTTGFPNLTIAFPLFPDAVTGSMVGQAIVSGAAGGGVGVVGANTTTVEEQLALCLVASVAVQVKGVVPTLKSEPDGGVQPTVTGCTPPVDTANRFTETALPSGEVSTGDGHVTDGLGNPVWPATSMDGCPSVP